MSRFAFLLVVGCVLFASSSASAQPKVNKVQPDSLPVGILHTGAIAEASFMIFAPPDDPNPKIKVDAPKFVKVLDTSTHAQEFGRGNSFTCVTIEVALDTSKAGELKGDIAVTIGETTTKVPVSATVKERKDGTPRILIAETPFERYSTGEGKSYKGWTDLVRDANLDVSYLLIHRKKPVLRDLDLSKYHCVLMSAGSLVYQTSDDVKRVRAYADNGGRVVVTANAFFAGSVKGANDVLDGYGLTILNTEAPGAPAKEIVLKKDNFAEELVKAGVEKAKFFRASPVRAEKGRLLVTSPEFVEPDVGYIATCKAGKGEIVAIGVSLWWWWVSEGQAKDSDNAKLLAWLLAPQKKK